MLALPWTQTDQWVRYNNTVKGIHRKVKRNKNFQKNSKVFGFCPSVDFSFKMRHDIEVYKVVMFYFSHARARARVSMKLEIRIEATLLTRPKLYMRHISRRFLSCLSCAGEDVDTSLLRQQQITLGLLKAARVLCSRQDNLRQILNHQAESSDGGSTFSLQQLMCSAIKPSPIKALFDREELEVRPCLAISLPEILQKKKKKMNA